MDWAASFSILTRPGVMTYILTGVLFTVVIAAAAVLVSIVLGSILALVRNYCTGKTRIFKWIATAYIELFRNTPLLLWIFVCLIICPVPGFLARRMLGLTSVEVQILFRAFVALVLFTSSVIAEIIRGGLNSIPKSQFEAARSQGFGFFASMRLIILPQTFKTIIPALFSQCTTVIKDSSYLAGINVMEFMFSAKVVMGYTSDLNQVLLLYGFVFLLYFVLNFGISLIVRAYQRRVVAA